MKRILSLIVLTAVLFSVAIPAFAAERTTFEIEEKAYYDINVPFDVTIGIGTDYDKAEILVDDTVVASYEGGSAGEISEELSLDGKVNYLGNIKISAKVYYGDEAEVVSKNILITKLGESINAFKEDFSAENSVYCGFIYNLGSNGPFQAHTFEDGNKTIKYVFDQNYKVDSQVFLSKDGMKIPKGSLITMQFDIYFSSNDCYLIFETRYFDPNTNKNEYPKDGTGTRPAITLFTKADKTIGGNPVEAETWYTCKYEMDTITKGLKIYIKERDEAEFTHEYTYPNYLSYGLNHIRPVFCCTSNTGAFTAVDNFTVDYIGEVPQWYAKHSFENAEGSAVNAGNVPVEGGKINLGFSKGMDITDGSILIQNEAEDNISVTSSYNETSFVYNVAPVKLRYGSLYSIVFNENLKSLDGNSALAGNKINFITAKHPIHIDTVTKRTDGIDVEIANSPSAVNETLAVCLYDANGAQIEYNLASVVQDGLTSVELDNMASADKIVIYVLSAAAGGEIYEIYTVE